MFTAEYIRNCNCNYERIMLEEKPEEKKYQYCILGRGGIRYLLPCSLRYIDSAAYLYYDISSTQNIMQVFKERKINREWIKDFLWGIKQMRYELDRFLLEEKCIIWNPEHIFQDLEKNDFFFLYMPYFDGENGLEELFTFWVEHVDYGDDALVEFVYEVHEKAHQIGLEYLHKQIHEDYLKMEQKDVKPVVEKQKTIPIEREEIVYESNVEEYQPKETERKGVRFFWEGRKKKQNQREEYREALKQRINGMPVYAVCEETRYAKDDEEEEFAEEFGKTIYIEESSLPKVAALYKTDGEKVVELIKMPFLIGKKKENVELVLNDYSASRIHARITCEEGIFYIEDLNSTNGTYKNGLRLQPYEKRRLEVGDELKFGKSEFIYR